jgi:hypothetical protein
MEINRWLEAAVADAERRGMPELRAMLETLAKSTANLRTADAEHRAADADRDIVHEDEP